ncbi:MAG: SDR family NAD(P)-dependent oxidoreductase [Hellea sp.]|nr:SDR family NAD(P)-dependent oxidoreductase [Hellea sp.]
MRLPDNFKSGFNRKSTAEDVTEGVDLSGKTVLITGAAGGLGQESMRVLALRGAHIIGLDRSKESVEAAGAGLSKGQLTAYGCDLADPDSIVACTDAIAKKFKVIDVVLTNAGIMAPPETIVSGKYSEPLEIQFAVNFLGHYVLINRLMPLIKAAPSARLAIVASEGYVTAPKKVGIALDDLDSQKRGYDALETYGHSKLAVMLMNLELARRFDGTSITANSIHPGVIRTNLASDSTDFKVKLISMFAGPWTRTIGQGAATHCFVAVHPSLDGVNGMHFADSNPKQPKGHALDQELAGRLWDKARELAADYVKPDNLFGT